MNKINFITDWSLTALFHKSMSLEGNLLRLRARAIHTTQLIFVTIYAVDISLFFFIKV